MSQNYTIQARDTRYYITSTPCDVDGQIVATADGSSGTVPQGATLTFNKAVNPNGGVTGLTVKGINGLYIALDPIVDSFRPEIQQNATTNHKLVWSTEPTNWQVDPTMTPFNGYYEIIPAGLDLYWYTEKAIGPIVQVKSGAEIKGTENQWTLAMVD
ncbi:hypothetical protein IW261DRAFT_1417876 [Armillaria novae-zelandiae]|uniref:Uncharacterized protein n=1 Tax=Armillaria novae-zelandiae TaxID=153914 RepID=A0AA39UAM5_9AGAR|nr:hypothetical protein IW261DRAFT_1417876 [Armillaria novae-zelandiae]